MERLSCDIIQLNLTGIAYSTRSAWLHAKKSTLINLLFAQEDYLSLVEVKHDVEMVFLDLPKVCHVVNHKLTIAKQFASGKSLYESLN